MYDAVVSCATFKILLLSFAATFCRPASVVVTDINTAALSNAAFNAALQLDQPRTPAAAPATSESSSPLDYFNATLVLPVRGDSVAEEKAEVKAEGGQHSGE
jgi:hypothetical protein